MGPSGIRIFKSGSLKFGRGALVLSMAAVSMTVHVTASDVDPCLAGDALTTALEGINTGANELSLAPDGRGGLLFERRGGAWGSGEGVSRIYRYDCATGETGAPLFAALADAGDPFIDAADGSLYFTSRGRPAAGRDDADIFVASRQTDGWSAPRRLPPPVNSSATEYSPVRRGEHLYFASSRPPLASAADGHLMVASQQDGAWSVQAMDGSINGPQGEWNLWLSGDREVLLFEASGRIQNVSVSGDLYASRRDAGGRWWPPVPLHDLNGAGSQLYPRRIGDWLVYADTEGQNHSDLRAVPWSEVTRAMDAAYGRSLWVSNRSSHQLSRVDLSRGVVSDTVDTGPGPHLLSASPDGGWLAAVAYGLFPRPHDGPVSQQPPWQSAAAGQVTLVPLGGGEARQFASGCERPHGSVWTGEGALWVSCEDRQGLMRLHWDPSDGPQTLERTFFSTDRPGAHVLLHDPSRHQLLAAHTQAGGIWWQPLDGGEGTFLALGPGSEALQGDPAGDSVWLTIGPAGDIAEIGLQDRTVRRRMNDVCGFPIDFARTSQGALWVACIGSAELVALDPVEGKVSRRIGLPAGPLNVVAHPQLAVLYAALPRRNEVVEVDLESGRISRVFPVGIEPDGMLITP